MSDHLLWTRLLDTNPHTITEGTTASSCPGQQQRCVDRRPLLLLLLLFLLGTVCTSALAFVSIPASARTAIMSETPAASTGGSQPHPHPQHALPVPPKAHKGVEKKSGETFTLGFLGGGMMASALIRGLIKAEVRGAGRGMDGYVMRRDAQP